MMFIIAFIIIIILSISINFLPEHYVKLLIKENGIIENATVVFYIAGAIASWMYAKRTILERGLSIGLMLILLALRELDFQKRFTAISITKIKFYVSPDIPLLEKIFVCTIVFFILIFIFSFVIKNSKALLRGFRNRKDWAISAMSGLLFLFFSKLIDSGRRILTKSLDIINYEYDNVLKTTEETAELAIPVFFLIAIIQYAKHSRNSIS